MLLYSLFVTSVYIQISNTPANLASYYFLDSPVARRPANRSSIKHSVAAIKKPIKKTFKYIKLGRNTKYTERCGVAK